MQDIGMILIPVLGGGLAGAAALLLVLWLAGATASGPSMPADRLSDPRSFRFRNGYLLDHSGAVGFLLGDPVDRMTAWADLGRALEPLVPGAGLALDALHRDGTAFRLEGEMGSDRIVVLGHREEDDLHVSVAASDAAQDYIRVDCESLEALAAERDALIRAGESSPALSWTMEADGRITWCNAAYRSLVNACLGQEAAHSWPPRTMFPDEEGARAGRFRRKCTDAAGEEHWFDVTVTGPDDDGTMQGHALSLDAVIAAETTLRTFIQTLTKSFAVMPTGLAIFDHGGRLALFNPALVDMTGLDGAFLSRRPRLRDVFSQLRARGDHPVPPGFADWCAGAEAGAAGRPRDPHVETLALPDGRSLRVTARPQGDGAVTVLLEDISGDVASERRSRRQQAMFGDILGHVNTAAMAFDAAGRRTLSTDLAAEMLFGPAGGIPMPETLPQCLTLLTSLSRRTSLWGEIRDLMQGPPEDRAPWDQDVTLNDGTRMWVRILPQSDGGLALALRSDRDLVCRDTILPDPPALTA